MSEYSPQAILDLYAAIHRLIGQAELSGVLGDSSHTYGYHRARNVLPAGDYSCHYGADKLGDGWAASALDVKLPTALMETVSARLMAAMKAEDPRVKAVREFFGTINGSVVTGWDRHALVDPKDGTYTTSDDSHLWHIHLSIYREFANERAVLLPIADVMAGVPAPQPKPTKPSIPKQETTVALSDDDVNRIAKAVWSYMLDRAPYDGTAGRHSAGWRLLDAELNARAAATGGTAPSPHPAPKAN